MPWQCAVVLLSLGCTLSCVRWGRLVAIVACRSGLYLGRSLSESYKQSKLLFRRTSWCLMASPHPRLIVWELKCLKWLFSSICYSCDWEVLAGAWGHDRVVSQVGRLSGGSVSCDLWHRRKVASLSVFFKIDSLVDHPVRGLFPAQYVLRRPTRGALAAHSRSFEMPRSRTVQFSRSFVLSCVRLWNGLHESVFAGEGVGAFKTSVNSFLLQGWLPAVSSFSSTISLSFFLSRDLR